MGKSISLPDLFQPTAGRNESRAFGMLLCPACRCYPFFCFPIMSWKVGVRCRFFNLVPIQTRVIVLVQRWLDLRETAEIFNPELRQGGPMSLRKVEKMQNFVVKRSIGNMCMLKGVISSCYCGSIVKYINADTPITKHKLVGEHLNNSWMAY